MPAVLLFGDGDRATGAGHQVRLAAIADALATRGLDVRLACRDLPGSTHAWAWRGRPTLLLDPALDPDAAVARARAGCAAVAIDHYGVRCAPGCIAISDGPGLGPPAGAALAVCPRPGAAADELPGVATIAGAAYLPLRSAFARRCGPLPGGPVLVAVGATDPDGIASRIAAALTRPVLTLPGGEPADVVAARLAGCSAAVVSASTIALECLALGLPTVVMVSVANHERLAAGLAVLGVPVLRLEGLSGLPAALARAAAPEAIDGGGARRIAERITELARWPAGSCLRWARWDDADRLLAWANDPAARQASFRSDVIQRDGHLAWYARMLGDPHCRVWIGEVEGRAVGSVRLTREGAAATVSITVAPEARGRGAGHRLLTDLANWAAATGFAGNLVAWIKDGNPASHRLFSRCDWLVAGRTLVAGHPATRYELPMEPSR
jgi:L-amino acid N-acyltransferase YncA